MQTKSRLFIVAVLAIVFHSTGCLRSIDKSKLKCLNDSNCPKPLVCSRTPQSDYGTCVSRSTVGPTIDGSLPDTSATDARGRTDAPSIDAPKGLDTAQVRTGGAVTATGGTVTATGGTITASGGTITASGGTLVTTGGTNVTTGGTVTASGGTVTATGGTIVATGGVSIPPDAAIPPEVDAPVIQPPDANPLRANGTTCQSADQCTNGFCVDGVCCGTKCDGQCESCKESGSLGTCKAVTGVPVGTRAACAGSGTCKGACDGKNGNACTYPSGSLVCTPASCTNGVATPAASCDGKGACDNATPAPCPSNLCTTDGSGKCAGACTATSCGTGSYCNTSGICATKKAPGALCANKDECTTGFCSPDGVCCDSACTGQCQACNTQGQCGRITGAPINGRTPCVANATCGGTCKGTSDSCVYPASEKTCTDAICSSDFVTATSASVCNGAGACTATQNTNCTSSGRYCSNGGCVAKLDIGGTCQNAIQCASGACCSGKCVNTTNDKSNCGGCNKPCGGTQVCLSSACGCNFGSLVCGNCAGWTFESNSNEGWHALLNTSTISTIRPSNLRSDTGSYSLEIVPNLPGPSSDTVTWVTPICSSSANALSLAGYTFEARLFFDTSESTGGFLTPYLNGPNGSETAMMWGGTLTAGLWSTVSFPITSTSPFHEIGLNWFSMASMPWNAKIYMDNARLYKP